MSALVILGVGVVGGIGALARFALDGTVASRVGREFPYGTLAVNLLGAFILGVLVGSEVGGTAYRIAGTGLIGAFTTFSTWMLECHRLGEDGQRRAIALNLAVSLALGLAAAWAGRQLGGWL